MKHGEEWILFYLQAKLVMPEITMAHTMYLWEKARQLCGFRGTAAEPVVVRPFWCTSCGAFVQKVFYFDGVPMHWADLHGEKTCGPCERTHEWDPLQSSH